MAPTTPLLRDVRHANFVLLAKSGTSLAAFARAVDINYTVVSAMKNGKREVTAGTCRKVEAALKLPAKWMEQPHPEPANPLSEHVRAVIGVPPADDMEVLSPRRIANVEGLTGQARGNKAAFCTAVGWAQNEFYTMRTRVLGRKRAYTLETKLGLPEGWFDLEHEFAADMPEAFEDRLAYVRQRAPVVPAPQVVQQGQGVAGGQLIQVKSPITRALIEKLISVGAKDLLPESRALEILNEVVALEQPAV